MKIEKQVVSLKLAKQLKEADYKQEGLWWWINYQGKIRVLRPDFVGTKICVAPTLAELGEELPSQIEYNRINTLLIMKRGQDYTVGYCNDKRLYEHYEITTIEADARAKMWLYLKKNNLLKET